MSKVVTGKDGSLHLYSKGVHFADAERFTLQFLSMGDSGAETVRKLYMVVEEITVTDAIGTAELIDELMGGGIPDIAFQGKYKTRDGFAERVIFRNCVTCGTFDVMQLAQGHLDAWAFWVNATEQELEQLNKS